MVCLSFDIEEFPVLHEKGIVLPIEKEVEISVIGTNKILDILKKHNIQATFFCTVNFVLYAPDTVKKIMNLGHEIASHGVYHCKPRYDAPVLSKQIIEYCIDNVVYGYRQPQMFSSSDSLISRCNYLYNSSINPTFIPGKYMNLSIPRTPFIKSNVLQIPSSVTPYTRFPLFWLSLHNLKESMYYRMVKSVIKHDGFFNTYFHPWEFVDHTQEIKKHMLPIVKKNIGTNMCIRLDNLISKLLSENVDFLTYKEFANLYLSRYHG